MLEEENSITIGVMSDSHRKVKLTSQAIEHLKQKGAQYLVHAGDLEIEENLELLENSGLTYVSVFGNNDMRLTSIQNKYKIYKKIRFSSVFYERDF